jgi:hypothetical protein
MPTLGRRNPNGGGPGVLRSSLANAALAVEDRVVWGAADLLRGVVDAVKWPFERIAWTVEDVLVWPIQEETAGWGRPTRAAVAAAAVALAGGAVAAGIVLSNPSGGGANQVETLAGPSAPAAIAGSKAAGPVLHGSAPILAPQAGGDVSKSAEPEVLSSEPGGAAELGSSGEAAAGSSGAKPASGNAPEVAGPAAIKVAHQFAGAFVLYEVGNHKGGVKATFAETASPDLTKALLRRPPRLPSNVKVPKAKVLNVVVGPTRGDTYTLSVSLLRLGVTSELRLDMKRDKGGSWRVTDVVG